MNAQKFVEIEVLSELISNDYVNLVFIKLCAAYRYIGIII